MLNFADQMLTMKELVAMLKTSRATIYDKMNPRSPRFDPDFPPRYRIGMRMIAFKLSEVLAWLKSRQINVQMAQ